MRLMSITSSGAADAVKEGNTTEGLNETGNLQ